MSKSSSTDNNKLTEASLILQDILSSIKKEPMYDEGESSTNIGQVAEFDNVSSEELENDVTDDGTIPVQKIVPIPINNIKKRSVESIDERKTKFSKLQDKQTLEARRIENSTINAGKREAFISGSLKAKDLINSSNTKKTNNFAKELQSIQMRCFSLLKLLKEPQRGFFATFPNVPIACGASKQKRSPLITNDLNVLFVSQASEENVQEAILGQRYRNIPKALQDTCSEIGVDLDAISQQISITNESSLSIQEETIFSQNSRTVYVQTDITGENFKTHHDKETQNTNNAGFFSCMIDLSKLNREQVEELQKFKKIMSSVINLRDEPTISGIKERLQHRRANNIRNNETGGKSLVFNSRDILLK